MDPLITGGILKGIFGMFGANRARRQAKRDAENKFVDLRKAAEKGGFNPLTALQATGGAGFGAGVYGSPALASVEALNGITDTVTDKMTGLSDIQMETARLNRDLARVELDRARSGYGLSASNWSPGGSSGGSSAKDASPSASGWLSNAWDNWLGQGLGFKENPTQVFSGWTAERWGNHNLYYKSTDGEPWGPGEIGAYVVQTAPQQAFWMGWDGASALGRKVSQWWNSSPTTPAGGGLSTYNPPPGSAVPADWWKQQP